MIPTIETIVENLLAGTLDKSLAITWLHQHAADAGRDLRDEFAAAALIGVMQICDKHHGADETYEPYFARLSYEIADAMLHARKA